MRAKAGRRWRRVARAMVTVPLLLLLGLIAIVAARPTLPVDGLLRRMAPRIEARTGLRVETQGARLTISLSPRLDVDDLTVSDSQGDLIAQATGGARVVVDLVPLLDGIVSVPELHVEHLQIDLAAARSMTFPASSSSTNGSSGGLPRLDLPVITVAQVDVSVSEQTRFELHDLSVSAPLVGTTALKTVLRWQGHRGYVDLAGGPLCALLASADRWPVSVDLTSDVGVAHFETVLPSALADIEEHSLLEVEINRRALDLVPSNRVVVIERLGMLSAAVTWQGWSLSNLLASADFQVRAEGIDLAALGLPISVTTADLLRSPTTGDALRAHGAVKGLPVSVDLTARPFRAWPPTQALEVEGALQMAGFVLDGGVRWRPEWPTHMIGADLTLKGPHLPPVASALDGSVAWKDGAFTYDTRVKLDVEDPAPWLEAVASPVSMSESLAVAARIGGTLRSVNITNLSARVGRSELQGSGAVQLGTNGPVIVADIHMPCLTAGDVVLVEKEATSASATTEPGAWHVSLTARIDEMNKDGEDLGQLDAAMDLSPGNIHLKHMGLSARGGQADIAYLRHGHSETTRVTVAVTSSNFPTSVLGHFIPQFSNAHGRVYAAASLTNTFRAAQRSVTNLQGTIGFALFPAEFRSSILDLWAGNTVISLVNMFTGQKGSKLQCIAGNFDVRSGRLLTRQSLMDTSDIRVHCKGVIDLGSGGLDMQLKPRPKKRSLISLATPIDIRGTLKDPEFRVQKKGLAKTGLRIYFWFVTVWEGLLRQQIPSYDFPAYMRVMNGEPP